MRNLDHVPAYLYISPRWTALNRLKCLRELAGRKQLVPDWRKARVQNFAAVLGLSPGMNSKDYGVRKEFTPVMISWKADMFRAEEWADECEHVGRTVEHKGWYSDSDCSRVLRAFVFRLSHGRWGCGYADSDTGERVYLLEVHPDAKSAAASADHEAQHYAEQEREHNERWNEAQEIKSEIEEGKQQIARLFALRNHASLGDDARAELADVIENVRAKRDTLADDYSDVDE